MLIVRKYTRNNAYSAQNKRNLRTLPVPGGPQRRITCKQIRNMTSLQMYSNKAFQSKNRIQTADFNRISRCL
jgi:hypothetical protein